MASPMPVLPLVASITVWPGFSSPLRSAASITPSASRSFTEPSGLKASSLTNSSTPGGANLAILTTGVRPTVSRMFSYRLAIVNLGREILGASAPDGRERRQRSFHHGIGRGEADAQMRGLVHERPGQHEYLAIGKPPPEPVRIPARPLAPEIERALRRQHVEAGLAQHRGQAIAPARQRGLIDRELFEVGDRVLHHGVGKTPAERH